MSMLGTSLSIPNPPQPLSFSFSLSLIGSNRLSYLPIRMPIASKTTTLIRMGGGPRTYPGGVSKWQWKRMQAKKAKQLLKARLSRERQIYEMRKRAELKAAVSELERPWEVVEKAPNLFSVRADEQVKVLADRFQRPGGFDLWTERDGPQLFETVDDLPSARFFPKGVVHSVRPYKRITGSEDSLVLDSVADDKIVSSFQENDYKTRGMSSSGKLRSGSFSEAEDYSDAEDFSSNNSLASPGSNSRNGKTYRGKFRNLGHRRKLESSTPVGSTKLDAGVNGLDRKQRVPAPGVHSGTRQHVRGKGLRKSRDSYSEVYDMSLEEDGSYRFQPTNSRLPRQPE